MPRIDGRSGPQAVSHKARSMPVPIILETHCHRLRRASNVPVFGEITLKLDEQVVQSLEASLNIRLDRQKLSPDSPLLGAIPEFDSMAVVALLTNLEEKFGFVVDDDEVDGTVFATIGSLTQFVRNKIAA